MSKKKEYIDNINKGKMYEKPLEQQEKIVEEHLEQQAEDTLEKPLKQQEKIVEEHFEQQAEDTIEKHEFRNRSIQKITLKNVGPFKEEQTIEFAPFTLIFGKNSAGKSYLLNVIHQLANPFRTAEEFADAGVKAFGDNYSHKNPINVKWEIPIYEGEEEQKIYFELNFGEQNKIKPKEISYEKDMQYLEISASHYEKIDRFILRINLSEPVITLDLLNRDQNKEKSVQDTELISDFEIAINNNQIEYDAVKLRTQMNKKKQKIYEITDKNILLLKSKEEKLKESEFRKIIKKFVEIINNSISVVAEQFDYIPAHRLTPSKQNSKEEFLKHYKNLWEKINTGEEDSKLSDNIIRQEQHYSLKEDIAENLAPKIKKSQEENLDSSQDINYWSADEILQWEGDLNTDWKAVFIFLLDRLGYGNYDFIVDYLKIEGMDELFKISIKKDSQGTKQSLDEIGYGISQVFPIITAVALSRDRLIVEEPEIHLHPSAQLNFIRALVELDKEKIRPFHYVFETHSQIIIEFLLSLVEKDKLDKDKVTVLYLSQTDDKTTVNQVEILDDGEIQNWPDNYFTELFEIEDMYE